MNYDEIIFFDLETSGLEPDQHSIIQIAAIDAVSGDEFCRKVKFRKKLASPEALAVNHYTDEAWGDAVCQIEAYNDFIEFTKNHAKQFRISKRTGKPYPVAVMAGHNIDKFDMAFLKAWNARFEGWMPIDYACYDTLQLARWVLPDFGGGYDLETLAKYFGVYSGTSHDALEDVRNNIKVAAGLLRRLEVENLPSWVKK